MGDVWQAYQTLGKTSIGDKGFDAFIHVGREVMMKAFLAERQKLSGSLSDINAKFEIQMELVARQSKVGVHALKTSNTLAAAMKISSRDAASGSISHASMMRSTREALQKSGDMWASLQPAHGEASRDATTMSIGVEAQQKSFLARRQGIKGSFEEINENYEIRMQLVPRRGPMPPDDALAIAGDLDKAMKL